MPRLRGSSLSTVPHSQKAFLAILLFVMALMAGTLWSCAEENSDAPESSTEIEQTATDTDLQKESTSSPDQEKDSSTEDAPSNAASSESSDTNTSPSQTESKDSSQKEKSSQIQSFSADDIPAYSGDLYIPINDNIPFFTKKDLYVRDLESYSPLDSLGRCGVALACIGTETMPTEERKSIGDVRPSGWVMNKYDFVDGKYLYNRCHLIGFQLAGENANERNLITGTRTLNVKGMLPFENTVADYVDQTSGHVLYRVTPLFKGDNLVASGVLMEARSLEDSGAGVCFNVFVYNVEPGVKINYATGENRAVHPQANANKNDSTQQNNSSQQSAKQTYILNTNTHKFHYPECSSVDRMSEANKKEVKDTRENLIKKGYEPCGRCNP